MPVYALFETLMNQKGVKVSDVADATGISPSTFSDWKNGKSYPKVDKLWLIAKFFAVPIESLLEDRKETGDGRK